jgi:hypothetical protein
MSLTGRAVVTVLAVATVAALAGCGRGQPAVATRQARSRSVIAQDAASLRWSWLVGRAEFQLVAQCMKRQGFAYAVPPADPEPGPATTTVDAIGRGDPPGYGVFPPHGQPSDTDHQPSYERALDGPPTALAAMTLPDGSTIGYQTGGCTAAARTSLFGSVRAYVASAYVPQVIRNDFDAFLTKDGPYTAALGAWRSCMAQRHWSFDAPAAAISSLQTARLDAASLDRRQAAVAGADRDCDSRSHLRARRAAALTRFTAGLSGRDLAELDGIQAGRQRAGRAAAVIARTSRTS